MRSLTAFKSWVAATFVSNSSGMVTAPQLAEALTDLADNVAAVTTGGVIVDTAPTSGSANAVQSGGVFTALAAKQASLVSASNIKTVNGTSLLGSGDLVVTGGSGTPDATLLNRANHTGTQVAATISDFAATVWATVLTGLSTATGAAISATDTVLAALGKLQAQITANSSALAGKQATLLSASNIKTVNGNSLLGSGDLVVTGSGGGTVDAAPTSGSANAVQSGGVFTALATKANLNGGNSWSGTQNFTTVSITGNTTIPSIFAAYAGGINIQDAYTQQIGNLDFNAIKFGNLTLPAAAALGVSSASGTKGIWFQPMTMTNRNAIVSPPNMLIINCSDATANDGSVGVMQSYHAASGTWKNHW